LADSRVQAPPVPQSESWVQVEHSWAEPVVEPVVVPALVPPVVVVPLPQLVGGATQWLVEVSHQ
jgi:hypothetical protein